MDNEGRSNLFRRKAVLPATLEARDLYLENIAWYPTDPDGTVVDNIGAFEKFYLTDNEATVLANANNTFALNFTPTDNVSSSVSSGEGWHDIENDAKNASLYDLTGKAESGRVKSINDANPTTPYSLINAIDTKGMKIGQLDGRGLAAINFDLIYDGLKQYPAISGKGYVGKAVMTFRSYKATEDKGSFTITINVKCRAHGDTIYLASADHLKMTYSNADSSIKETFTISACTRTSQAPDWQNPRANGVGKSPSKYVNNFTDAFNKSIYQEGDVICILDTVFIRPGQQLTIQGADYAAVPIIRYTGHHHEWPGEKAVYRGPMIVVKGGEVNHVKKTTSFSTRSIAIDGSSLGKRKNIKIVDGAWQVDTNYYPDTNAVYGPIIAVSNNHGRKTTVSLEHNTSISNNWNIAGASAPSAQHGAISVTDSAILELTNSVTIENNLNVNHPIVNAAETTDVRIPRDGAVYVDHGILSLGESHKETAVTITDNYLYRPTVPAGENYRFWKSIYKEKVGGDSLMRYSFDADKAAIDTATRANVFLTRRGAGPRDFMTDIQSDTIVFTTSVAEGTRIGITKWFPGITTRDTIKVVMQPSGNLGYINEVMTHHNFYSDDPRYDTLYSTGIDNKTIFLHRCATFKQQVADVAISSLLPIENVPTHDALYYGAITEATCPTGGDTVIFRVQGGFFPYIYTWSSSTSGELQRDTTPYANNIVMSAVRATRSVTPNYTMVNASIADTFFTPHTDMSHQTVQKDIDLTVVATDVAGCRQKKTINLALQKTETGLPKFTKTPTDSYWIDGDSTHIATGDRNFKAIRVYPRVWADRTQGVISAKIAGDANDIIYLEDESSNHHDLEGLLFCEGDVIRLATMPTYGKNSRFIMWDFDPYYNSQVNYVVPSASDTVRAYYGPRKYWKDTITNVTLAKAAYDDNYYYTNRNGKSYVTTYNGDVHIYDEDGLAWFISVVNGYNGTQARSFFFNSVYLHGKDGGYDMKDYLWTPVGAMQHPFRGRFIGANKSTSDSCVEAGASRVIIKNIIIDEPNVDYTGFFGFLDSAWVENIELQGALVRGAQYVGGLAASTRQTNIVNCAVADSSNKDKSATILTTHYASGGMVGKADQTTITGSETAAKYVGDAVYNGGVVGYGTATKVYNSGLCNISRMQSVYAGGVAGYLDDGPSNNPLTLSKDGGYNDGLSRVMNNYVYFTSQGNNQRAGGLVGYAKNTVIENNYVYGDIVGAATEGGVGAVLDAGSIATNNYYERSAAPRSVGQQRNTASSSRNITFSGEGNQVILGSSNYGINNLTRALNIWVRTKSEGFNTWRSDLEHHNDGYPLFGAPDMIPVSDSLLVTGCDSVEWDGQVYLFDDEVVTHVIDSVMMVDSTFTLHIRLNHASRETLTDTAVMGQPYSGHGFQLTARELTMLQLSAVAHGTTSIILTDTLQNAIGCDSIVTLMLTVRQNVGIVEATPANRIKVYPNPTTSRVTIEATEAMSHVELYDNQGRRVEDYNTRDNNNITIDVSRYPAGAYYLRVYTAGNVTIQKLIKK